MEELTEENLKELLTFANAAASLITTRKGALRVMPTREEIKKKMSGNLCRCTGYQNIVNAVEKVMHENAEKGI